MTNRSLAMPRTALCGGMAFTPLSQVLDKALIRLTGVQSPRITLIGASPDPRGVFRAAKGHFNPFGGYIIPTRLGVSEPQSDMLALEDALAQSQIIYLTDGSPAYLMEIFSQGKSLSAIRQAWLNGVMLIAQGAGAMALCDTFWNGDGWEPGLGLLHGIAVIPHHERLSARFSPERLRRDLPAATVILGIDEGTGAVLEGRSGQVLGAATVTLYHATDSKVYSPGDSFTLAHSPLEAAG